MKKALKNAVCALSVLSLLGISGAAVAAEQVKEGFHPNVNGSPVTLMKDNMITQALGGRATNLDLWVGEFFKFDDNIYNSKAGKRKSEMIYSTAAGFKFDKAEPNLWKVDLEGQIQYNVYGNHTKHNGFEGFMKANASADFSPALSARVKADYAYAYDNDATVEDIVGLHKYHAGTGVTLRPSPYAGIDIDYTFYGQNRDKSAYRFQNYFENSISLRPYWEMTDFATIYAVLGASAVTYEKDWNNDSIGLNAALGLSWSFKDEAKAFIEVGVRHLDIDDNGQIARYGIDGHDSVTRPSFRMGGELAITDEWKTGATFSFAPTLSAESTNASQSNYIDRTVTSLFLDYCPGAGRFTARLTPFYAHSEPSANENYDEYGTHLGLSYSITEWFNVSAGYRYSVVDKKRTGKRDRNQATLGFAATF